MTVLVVGWFAVNLSRYVGDGRLHDGRMPIGEFARRMGTVPRAVRRWLDGTSVPSVEKAAVMADALGVPPERMLLPPARDYPVDDPPARPDGDPPAYTRAYLTR